MAVRRVHGRQESQYGPFSSQMRSNTASLAAYLASRQPYGPLQPSYYPADAVDGPVAAGEDGGARVCTGCRRPCTDPPIHARCTAR